MLRHLLPLLLVVPIVGACDSKPAASTASGTSAPAAGVAEGNKAPDVELVLHDGKKLKLSSLTGSSVLLYFYPKDDTPG